MKSKFAFTFLLFLAACAGSAAQEPTGKFTVSHDSRWGTAVLPAGTYVVSVHSGPVPFVTVSSQDHNAVSIMAVAEYLDSAQCETSSLQLEQGGEGWNVRSLCFASQLSLYFRPAKFKPQRTLAAPEVASLSGR
jgi:hypothetical protein